MSNSLRPQRRQPTRLPRPRDSPGKNTGVGCRFLLQCMKVKSEREVAQSCPTLSNAMDCSPPGSSIHGILQARVLEWVAIAFSEINGNTIQRTVWTECDPYQITHEIFHGTRTNNTNTYMEPKKTQNCQVRVKKLSGKRTKQQV